MLSGKEFFLKTFKEGYTGDTEQASEDVADTPEVTEVPEVSTEVVEETVETPEVVQADKFSIDGEEVTIDQIKEWKQNGLRQSDYTKKTQELAEQRKQLETLKGTIPEVDVHSESERLAKIERDLASKELDLEITNFKVKYPDFDEIKVLTEAERRGVYDLEFVYKALRDDIPATQLNVEELKTQAIEEYKAQIATKKQSNKDLTAGSIVSSTPGVVAVDYGEELSHSEKEYCNRRGWSYKDYADMKSNDYKL